MKKIALAAVLLCGPALCRAESGSSCNYWLIAHGGKTQFWEVLEKGARDAALALGCTVQVYLSAGDVKAQQDKFLRAVAERPDGIALSIVSDSIFDEPIAKAIASGIPVLAVNNDDSRGAAGNKRLCYIGQDDENAAYKLTLLLIEQAGKRGLDTFALQTLVFAEEPGSNFNSKRLAGVSRALGEYGMKPPKVMDFGRSRNEFARKAESYLDIPGGNAMVVAAGADMSEALCAAMKSSGRKPGDLIAGGFDLGASVMDCVKAGYLAATVDQQQYLQGYFSVYMLWLYNRYGFAADVDTGRSLVDNPQDLARLERLAPLKVR